MTQNILFITANRIGDAVLSTGVLNHLVQTYPDAALTVVCGPVAADLFRATPHIANLIVMKKQKRHGHWRALWHVCFGTKWNLIVDLRNSLVSRLLRSKARAYRPSHMTGNHKVEDNAVALKLNPPPSPVVWLDEKAVTEAACLMPAGQTILALGPAANWPAKQWSCFNFICLAKKLTAPDGPLAGAKILITAAPHERSQIEPLMKAFPSDQIIEATNLDLLSVAACLKSCRLFIGNDSGLMHIAAATGIPTLGLFGPSFANVYGPWGPKTAIAHTKESTESLIARMEYPGADHPNLMTSLTVDEVFNAAVQLLKKTA